MGAAYYEAKLAYDQSFRSRYSEELSLIENCHRRLVGLAALYWKYKTDALFRYLEQGLPVAGVCYERLVANPRSTLQSVCAHLGIPSTKISCGTTSFRMANYSQTV